ncbi:MAG: AAA family ATPase [Cryobacterium sp.]
MVDQELQREQGYVSALYARLDALQAEAVQQLTAVRAITVGGNHQAKSERDALARLYEDRIMQLREVADRLAFGRLETAPDPATGDPVFRYIGRVGLRDDHQHPLLLDWRVPSASAFYQATAATPLGARSRRHLTSQGRTVTRIDDEVLDPTLLEGDTADTLHQGEGALLAALSAQRTGQMSDIVSTIQAEQDRIIRSGLNGVLVVQGGPGTGKTAVALHRAAYLLYTHRDRLQNSGVLIVGPSRSFLQYIDAVLPSLGETGVVLASVGQLYPGVEATREDAPDVAALKGETLMADLIGRAVRSRQRVPTAPTRLVVDGDPLTLHPQVIQNAVHQARSTGRPHNEARVVFVKNALAALARDLLAELQRRGRSLDESDLPMLREDLRTSHDVRVALNTAWLPLTPDKLVRDLYARPEWLAEITPGWTAAQRALLARPRDAELSVADIPLLDEAAELLGEYTAVNEAKNRAEQAARAHDLENAEAAIANMRVGGLVTAEALADGFAERGERVSTADRAAHDRSWTYGHVVVDEAQELSPMQWRLLLRRGPRRSFTIVGDIAQAASASAARSWEDALQPILDSSFEQDRWRLEELTVNYRTPSQIAAVAEAEARRHGLPITSSRAVRSSRWPVETVTDVIAAIARDRALPEAGTLAVIVVDAGIGALHEHLAAAFGTAVGLGVQGLSRDIALLTPYESKGLEFDAVIVVDAPAILAASARGAGALYVAMTRSTQRLYLVESGPEPA